MAKILIVEDEKIVAKDIEYRLRKLGYTVTGMATSGRDALQKAEETVPDLVLMDIQIKGDMDGIAAAEALRQRLQLPVIYLTAYADEPTLRRAKITLPYGYLLKPFEERDLHTAIEVALRQHELQRTLERRATHLALINDIGSQIATELALHSVLQRAVHLIQQTFGYHHVAIFLLEDGFAQLRAVAGVHEQYLVLTYRQSINDGIIGWVARHGEKIVANDISQEPRYLPFITDYFTASAELCLPIKVAGQTVGILDIQCSHSHTFDQNDVMVMETLTSQIAVAIRNAQLYEQAQQEKEALERQQMLLQTILDHIPVMVSYFDRKGCCQWVNREWERISGWSWHEIQGRNMFAEFYPDPSEQQRVRAAIFAAEGRWDEIKTRVRDGRLIDTIWASVRLPDGSTLGIGADITERKQLEAQFFQAQKLEAIGRLAGGLAHDFNNILTVIMSYTSLGMRVSRTDQPIQRHLKGIQENAERAANLTRQLLSFARKQVVEPQNVNLNELIVRSEKMIRPLLGEEIQLTINLAPDVGWVKADPNQLEQVVLNLVLNARDAMPQGGHLTLQTANVSLEPQANGRGDEAPPGDYVMLLLKDTGSGMSEEVKAHLFEPFFTTKVRGKGTGLGLAICFGIIKQSEGYIRVESEVGRGATFRIYLPYLAATGVATTPQKLVERLPGGNETILLVEDEPEVRALTVNLLKEHGYTLLVAANGAEALYISDEQASTPIDLLLTDVVMPLLGGKALAERLKTRRPETKVLLISGYTDEAVVAPTLPPGTAFLQKPFSPTALLAKVREVLDA